MLILREAWEAIPFIVLMVRQKIPLALFISSPVAIESTPLKGTGEVNRKILNYGKIYYYNVKLL